MDYMQIRVLLLVNFRVSLWRPVLLLINTRLHTTPQSIKQGSQEHHQVQAKPKIIKSCTKAIREDQAKNWCLRLLTCRAKILTLMEQEMLQAGTRIRTGSSTPSCLQLSRGLAIHPHQQTQQLQDYNNKLHCQSKAYSSLPWARQSGTKSQLSSNSKKNWLPAYKMRIFGTTHQIDIEQTTHTAYQRVRMSAEKQLTVHIYINQQYLIQFILFKTQE
ncbi:hypothetical protein FGO68_gene709 [Halteria grandinella]|uniref:Uncharacterized protein n=1 Tax=Halteria grandinella TaxID=5974 RepID=A0A8J8P0E3_HALGN|nr:hypothetical protein FGO68_gene709 [Halteria grandinella]